MIEDIVTRLQDYDFNGCDGLLFEAADEIERLRSNLQLMVIDYRTQIAGMKMRCKCGACE